MDSRTLRIFVGALGILLAVAVVSTILGSSAAPVLTRPNAPTVDGVVVHVESGGLSKVTSFTLRTTDGRSLVFDLSALQNGVQFAPGHLAEHQATAVAVRVWYRDDAGRLSALWLEDAPAT